MGQKQRCPYSDTAFAYIFARHQPDIYRYIFFRVGDVATAEDLTSDVFVRLVEKIDRFTYQDRPLLAWLYTIARNLVTDHLRRVGQTTILPPYKQAVTDTGNPEQAVEWNLTQRQLVVAPRTNGKPSSSNSSRS